MFHKHQSSSQFFLGGHAIFIYLKGIDLSVCGTGLVLLEHC